MYVILLGPPGAGKGTQGKLLAQRAGLPKVATGDVIRAAMRDETPLGRKAKEFYDQGLLVPDDVILGLIEEVLAAPNAANGVIMDGFPRTVAQAGAVDRLLRKRNAAVDHVLEFQVPRDELVRRLAGRAAVEGRVDDSPEAIAKRLEVYREQTEPLIVFYRSRGILTVIQGTGDVDTIAERVQEAVGA